MALALFDRVQQTGTANTTVSFTLTGSVVGFQSFAAIGNGNTTFYSATDVSGNWETGLGTYSTTGPTLTRTAVFQSSNANAAVTFSGAVSVWVDYPSSKSVNLDASGNVSALGTITSGTWNAGVIPVTYGGTGVSSSSGANSVVLRDSNANVNFNNFTANANAVTASAGTTVLTAASARTQVLVGSTTHTFQLPDATTLLLGQSFLFVNNSSGVLTVKDNASTTVETIPSGGVTQLGAVSIATSAGTWGAYSFIPAAVDWGTNALNLATTVISGGTWNGGTITPAYGGTGLTSYTSGGAVYASSGTTLTSGTLPVPSGGTGQTSFAAGYIPYGDTTAALQSSASLQFNGTYLVVGGGTPISGSVNPIATFIKSDNNYVQTYTHNTNSGTSASSDFACYADNGTDTSGFVDLGISSSTYSDASYSVTGPNESYLLASSASGAGASGNMVYATDSTGSDNSHQWYIGGFNQAKGSWKMQLTSTGLQIANALDVTGAFRSTSATIADAATITPTSDTTNQYTVTALAQPATIDIPSGTPIDGQKLTIRIKDDGTAQALTWTTSAGGYREVNTTLPTTTTAGKVTYVGCIYNSQDTYWDVVAVATQA